MSKSASILPSSALDAGRYMESETGGKVSWLVAVIDDDISVRESLDLLIHSVGWAAQTFASAQLFQARPRHRAPDCLIVDATLQDIERLDLRGIFPGDQLEIPLIFITGYDEIPASARALTRTPTPEILRKPFSGDDLLSAIENAVKGTRRR